MHYECSAILNSERLIRLHLSRSGIAFERIVTNIYTSEESIQYHAVIWHDLIARRHGLADAYW